MRTGYIYGKLGPGAGTLALSPDYWFSSLEHYAQRWSEVQQNRFNDLTMQGARIAYWRSDKDGRACNHTPPRNVVEVNEPRQAGMIERVEGKLVICTQTALHATMKPPRWSGSRIWIVALLGEVIGDEDKFAAQTREIIGECSEVPEEWK